MNSKTFIKFAVAIIVFVLICAFAVYLAPRGEQNNLGLVWYSIIPPLLAITLAFLTRHVLLSLGIAVIAGGLLSKVPLSPLSATAWVEGLASIRGCFAGTVTDTSNLLILSFIPPIFIMIEVILVSGGFNGIINWLLKWIKGAKSAQAATAIMGILCFIDDYTNAIIVGSMMQPITDRHKVSREKLAFIVDATSAPIAGLAVISTWITYEVGLLADIGKRPGIDKSGYAMFFDALSFRFYCLLMIVFVFMNILAGRDFGPMKAAQKRIRRSISGNGSSPNLDRQKLKIKDGRAINALIPLVGLVLFHLSGLWFDGTSRLKADMLNWQAQSVNASIESMPAKPVDIEAISPLSWVYWREVISNAKNSHLMLVCAAIFGLTLALLCGRFFSGLQFSSVYVSFKRGIKRAALPIAILILAWSLKSTCDSLKTDKFLTAILAGKVSSYLFPPALFLVASIVSFATGTSYGTMGILIPTAIPVALELDGGTYGLTTMISVGAVLDGAIFGDHCSPISDTTIMSSVASSCDLMEHVRTQLPYSLFVAGLALLFAYLPSALGLGPGWSFVLAVSLMGCFFIVLFKFGKAHNTC
ncbi:MAG: hypothetical protein JW715_08870 [Sedimentisphaerales bacterium]|nr:hypothetical protein [Sedimentisphaerales bacterium]